MLIFLLSLLSYGIRHSITFVGYPRKKENATFLCICMLYNIQIPSTYRWLRVLNLLYEGHEFPFRSSCCVRLCTAHYVFSYFTAMQQANSWIHRRLILHSISTSKSVSAEIQALLALDSVLLRAPLNRAVYFLTQGQLCELDINRERPQSSRHTDSNISKAQSDAAQQFII